MLRSVFAVDLRDADRALTDGDYAKAVAIYETLIEQGVASAMVRLGALYRKGEGVAFDPAQAARLYRRAADLGDAEGQFNLGNAYLLGEGVRQDDVWALTYYRLAAQQGHALAERNLRELYRAAGIAPPAMAVPAAPAGPGSRRDSAQPRAARVDDGATKAAGAVPSVAAEAPFSDDEARAIEFARAHGIVIRLEGTVAAEYARAPGRTLVPRAAEHAAPQSARDAQDDTAMVAAGRALEQHRYRAAFGGLQGLAHSGNAEAQFELSRLLAMGRGAAKDEQAALRWLQQSAAGGYPEAQFALAERYLSGRGVVADEAMAITLYREAARAGHERARERLSRIYTDAGLPVPDFSGPREPIAVPRPPAPAGDEDGVAEPRSRGPGAVGAPGAGSPAAPRRAPLAHEYRPRAVPLV